jgi:phage tail tape-measure protein
MDVVYVVNFAVSLVVGILGGLIGTWASLRYQLVLEQRQKDMEAAFDDRLNTLQKIVTRQDKTAAVTARWEKTKKADEALVNELTTVPAVRPKMHPWDPRLWGKD